MQSLSTIPVVIAAGGEGSRIGGDKPHLMLGGVTLLDHALARATSWSPVVAVALRDAISPALPKTIVTLFDEIARAGPLSALSSALAFARSRAADRVLLIPCDMPFLPDDLLQRLVQEIGSDEVAMARSHGQVHPICALWATSALEKIEAYAASGRRSLFGFADGLESRLVDWGGTDSDPFFNINSPEDLAQAAMILHQNSIA